MRLLALALLLLISSDGFEYRVTLSYYSVPIKNREWSVSVYRKGTKSYIEVDNYNNRKLIQRLSGDEYVNLLDFLHRKGIWHLKDFYPGRKVNPYHLIEVESGGYKNSFKVESGPLSSGGASAYREIIRKLENLARVRLVN